MREPIVFPAYFIVCDKGASLDDIKSAVESLVEANDQAKDIHLWTVAGTDTTRILVPEKAFKYGVKSGIFPPIKEEDKE